MNSERPPQRRELWYFLLLVPFIALSIVPIFNSIEPRVLGVPFFWWYQFLWIPLAAGLTGIVYWLSERNAAAGRDR